MQDKPVFILGSARSGTTLLQRIINSQENFAISGEHGGFLAGICNSYYSINSPIPQKYLLDPEFSNTDGNKFLNKIKNPEHWSAWTNSFDSDSVDQLYINFIKNFFYTEPDKRWGFKEIRYCFKDKIVDFLIELFPNAKFIIIVRNPLDVVLSQISTFGREKEMYKTISDNWVIQNSNFLKYKEKYPDNIFILKYEDLIKGDLTELNDFLGIKDILKIEEILSLSKGRGADQKADKRDNILSQEELKDIQNITKGLAQKFGY